MVMRMKHVAKCERRAGNHGNRRVTLFSLVANVANVLQDAPNESYLEALEVIEIATHIKKK